MIFLLEPDGSLKYTLKRDDNEVESLLIDENILIYDYTKDFDNSHHLIYLKVGGDLYYVVFKEGGFTKSVIGKFDTKSNSYNQISLLMVKSKINIFYSYSNIINSNIYTLHHVIFSNGIEEKHTIIRYVSKKTDLSFMASIDSSGNIHLFYNTVSNSFSYIYYTYFNPFTNRWLSNPIKLSSSEKFSEYPCIFVDSRDNIHGAWWEKSSDGYYLKYMRMSSIGKARFKWNAINIPTIVQDKPFSQFSEVDYKLITTCNEYDLISNDYGITWAQEKRKLVLDIPSELALSNTNDLDIIEEAVETDSHYNDNNNQKAVECDNFEQILLNQKELKALLNNMMEEQLLIRSKVQNIEENTKHTTSGFRRFFS